MLSTMHAESNVESNTFAKPEIITYYNKTKGGVDNMDKLLGEYTCKRGTSRWPLSLFFNAIDIAALASYIIYMEFNTQHKSTDRRRKFLKDLSIDLCRENIEQRAKSTKISSQSSTASAMQIFYTQDFETLTSPISSLQTKDKSGRIPVVGSCHVCSQLRMKQRKTRKACVGCSKPICNDHTISRPVCINCSNDLR